MSSISEIKEAQSELDRLIEEYHEETAPCQTKSCGFFKDGITGNCSWSNLLEDCREYDSDIEDEEEE